MSKDTLGARIALVRGHMTQEEFAKRLGIGRATLVRYEKNENDTPSSILQVLIKEFGADPQWLLLGVGESLKEEERREAILLSHFRHCDEAGKDAMLTTGAALAQPQAKMK